MTPRRIGTVGFVMLLASLSAAPAFAQRKIANFGGIPTKLFNEITGECSGTLPTGVTLDIANRLLLRLAQEEHAAANPGPGVTGIMDAFLAFEEMRAAFQAFKDAPAANKDTTGKVLGDK